VFGRLFELLKSILRPINPALAKDVRSLRIRLRLFELSRVIIPGLTFCMTRTGLLGVLGGVSMTTELLFIPSLNRSFYCLSQSG